MLTFGKFLLFAMIPVAIWGITWSLEAVTKESDFVGAYIILFICTSYSIGASYWLIDDYLKRKK